MIRAMIAAVARQERHSVTAALGLAIVAILFAQMILPGLAALAFHEVRGAPPQPGGGAESPLPPVHRPMKGE